MGGSMDRRTKIAAIAALSVLIGVAVFIARAHRTFPSERTPDGAYLRLVLAITKGQPVECFPYLETQAQWACHTIRDYRSRAQARIAESYPEPERTRLLSAHRPEAEAADGAGIWVLLAERRGWIARLRGDLSGIKGVEIAGERATIETARGTRYAFRKGENGIWGLTLFTAELLEESERAARDHDLITRAADDYASAADGGAP
jgi:hypothetical protein